MALIKGFPPSNLISPSVRIAEKDLSFIAPEQTGHRAGLVGFSSKGPINIPTLVTTSRQLHTVYGYPHPDVGDPYLVYASEQYLSVANELFIVRVADTSPVSSEAATTASVEIDTAGGPVQIEGNIPVGSGWSFPNDVFFRWRLNGILASKILVVLSDNNRPGAFEGLPYEANELVDALNEQLSPTIDGIEFYYTDADINGDPTTASLLGIQSTFAYGTAATLEMVSVTDSLYGPDSVVGIGTLMEPASVAGTSTQYPPSSIATPGQFDFSGFSADSVNLQIVVDGTDNVLIDNVVQLVVLASANQTVQDIADDINAAITAGDIPGGFTASAPYNVLVLTTDHVGADTKIFVKPTSTAAALMGLDADTHRGVSPTCATAPGATYSCGIVTGTATGGTLCFTVTADSPGIDGNDINLVITNNIADGNFTIEVYLDTGISSSQVEAWGNLTKDQASFYYVESYIATVSDYIRVLDNTDTLAMPLPSTISNPYVLSGGTDGIPSDPDLQDELLLGSSLSMTGLQALSDPEQVDIDLIAIPGHTSTAIVGGLLDFCQISRQDCFSIIDSPFGLTVNEIIQWQNGVHPLNGNRFDSDFGALYWPWLKTRDGYNRVDVWVPPSGSVMATYARSDSLSAPWFAPAGETRGLVPNILDVFSRPTLADRDSMYGNRNAVNPIIQFADLDGFHVWGQKTLQRRPTALDRVNVRRMLLFVEKQVRRDVRVLLFEPNDEVLWRDFIRITTAILERVRLGRGVTDYVIKCDAELNTPDVIDRNELRARIGVQPTRAVEFIFIEFSIHRTGSFGEAADNF